MKSILIVLSSLLFLPLLFSCEPTAPEVVAEPPAEPSLKSAFIDDFMVGAALNNGQINGTDTAGLRIMAREFNTITPENIMKWENIQPAADQFDWTMSDKYVALGEKNDQFIIGHALVWHSQLAPYVEAEQDSATLQRFISEHIKGVVGRYKGRIDAWDVVNEALNDDGTLRESVFYTTLGEDYLRESFSLAAAADPEAELYYNDYNLWMPAKRDGAIRMIKKIQASGTKIDGIGMQAHYSTVGPDLADVEAAILAYAELGLKVMFTEMDITALPNPWDLQGAEVSQNFENSPFMDPFTAGLSDSMQVAMSERYSNLFKLLLKHRNKITRVTFWGINDSQSWLNDWPIKGRTNYPLLFDRDFKKKPAYDAVMKLKE